MFLVWILPAVARWNQQQAMNCSTRHFACLGSRFLHEKIMEITNQPKKWSKKLDFGWILFFAPDSVFFFFSGMPIAVWVVCNTPSIDFFRSVGVRSASCKNKSQIWPIGSYVLWSKVEDLARSCHHSWHSTFRAKVEDLPPVDIYNFRIGDLKKNIFVCHLFFEEKTSQDTMYSRFVFLNLRIPDFANKNSRNAGLQLWRPWRTGPVLPSPE